MIFSNSLRQMFRTPVKTILFLLLLIFSVLLLAVGTSLWLVSGRNLQNLEDSFITIGTVQQKANSLQTEARWNPWTKEYQYFNAALYDEMIPLSVLNFAGANYLQPPERRPYYGAYSETYDMGQDDEQLLTQLVIVEAEPLADCDASEIVKMRVTKNLLGYLEVGTIFGFCDGNDQPAPMYAGKKYMMSLSTYPVHLHEGFEDEGMIYLPAEGIESNQFDKNGGRVADLDVPEYVAWEEVTPGYYDTPRGQRWYELVKAYERFFQTIPVTPTNATYLLMDFYNSGAQIVDGRDITPEEYAQGEKVCLVQQAFARDNGLKPGDSVPLPLYYANYKYAASQDFSSMGWDIPNLLSAQGKAYQVFQDEEYEIVGIYNSMGSYQTSGFESGRKMAVIPAASVTSSDENNILNYAPLKAYNTSFRIPNGAIEAYTQVFAAQNIAGLDIEFYDKGYTQLKDGFDRMRSLSAILLIVGVAVTLLVLIFFTYLFIVKNKRRTAIERSLGYSREQCAASILAGLAPLYAAGIGIGSVCAYFLNTVASKNIVNAGAAGAFDTAFSNWVNNADKLAEEQLAMQTVSPEVFALVAGCVLAACVVIAFVGIYFNLKSEPMELLSRRDSR